MPEIRQNPEMPQEGPVNVDAKILRKKYEITFKDSTGNVYGAHSIAEMIDRIKEERENMN